MKEIWQIKKQKRNDITELDTEEFDVPREHGADFLEEGMKVFIEGNEFHPRHTESE